MPTKVITGRSTMQSEICSISTSGARLRGLKGVQPGDKLTLRLRQAEMVARVAWFDGIFCGVQFARPICEPEVFLIRKAVAGRYCGAAPQRA